MLRHLFKTALLPVAGAALALLAAAPAALAQEPTAAEAARIGPEERVLGKADAPLTIIEYASLTCPHCAHFHTTVLPALKQGYISAGKARIVYRDFPLDRLALAASTLARCGVDEDEDPFAVLNALFSEQESWATAEDPLQGLVETLEPFGTTRERAESCLQQEEVIESVVAGAQAGLDAFEIDGTPTFIVNGEKVESLNEVDQLAKVLDPLLKE